MIATILRWLGFEPQWKRAFNLTPEQRSARTAKGMQPAPVCVLRRSRTMGDLAAKGAEAGRLLREISDEIGHTVRLRYRQPDECISVGSFMVTIEGYDLPCGYVSGLGESSAGALNEALAALAGPALRKAA